MLLRFFEALTLSLAPILMILMFGMMAVPYTMSTYVLPKEKKMIEEYNEYNEYNEMKKEIREMNPSY